VICMLKKEVFEMGRYIIPDMFRAEDIDILGALKKVSAAQGLTEQEAQEIFVLLPETLKRAPAFKDRLTGIWRYEYGIPYTIGNGANQRFLLGTDQAPKVSVLFNGIRALCKHLSYEHLRQFLKRLENREKHLDLLSELDPIMRPVINFVAEYEPNGYASGNRKIDWLIKFEDDCNYLIDVKNRIKGILNFAEEIAQKGKSNVQSSAPPPIEVFKSCEIKFLPVKQGYLQGIWVLTNVYYDDILLQKFFNDLNDSLIQFAVFTHFEGKARILTKRAEIKSQLMTKFCLVEMEKR